MNPKNLFILSVAFALAACAGIAADPSKMSADQLREVAKEKNAVISCWNGKTAAGNVTMTYVNNAQAQRFSSVTTVESDCKTVVQIVAQPDPAASAAK
jgi:hypothetical protein